MFSIGSSSLRLSILLVSMSYFSYIQIEDGGFSGRGWRFFQSPCTFKRFHCNHSDLQVAQGHTKRLLNAQTQLQNTSML